MDVTLNTPSENKISEKLTMLRLPTEEMHLAFLPFCLASLLQRIAQPTDGVSSPNSGSVGSRPARGT